MFDIEGKVAFITGGLGGIGRAYVKELLKCKAKAVVITDIDDSLAEKFQEEVASEFGPNKTMFIKADARSTKELDDAMQKTVDVYKNLDIVIGNAGVLDEIDFVNTIDVNLIGALKLLYLAVDKYLPKYKSGEDAVLFNSASVSGINPVNVLPAYSASKHGLVAITRSLGRPEHYATHKVRIVTVCGTVTDTPMSHHFRAPKNYMDLYNPFHQQVLASMQTCESAAKAMILSITQGENGSVWFSEKDKPATVVKFPVLGEIL
ncbi:PREDICTED: 15-hydroxyprostaglandin dehydrogenase [NAD(+)]-like [Nicrophorus vespilloides]|uniref:15-hydroxyprostaglandin dehydrogenase [NAD(+)]-like n=1 Tax=Nicrophorus vespilloides TaxID=110193 RepID=A0ABM1MKH3_NICVS|nr:PREDICTED: 15-hydroxyprostaglandin dehydrogenase [NAD(+)]-like [Nicrophorus vespilloides]